MTTLLWLKELTLSTTKTTVSLVLNTTVLSLLECPVPRSWMLILPLQEKKFSIYKEKKEHRLGQLAGWTHWLIPLLHYCCYTSGHHTCCSHDRIVFLFFFAGKNCLPLKVPALVFHVFLVHRLQRCYCAPNSSNRTANPFLKMKTEKHAGWSMQF